MLLDQFEPLIERRLRALCRADAAQVEGVHLVGKLQRCIQRGKTFNTRRLAQQPLDLDLANGRRDLRMRCVNYTLRAFAPG